MSCGYQGRVGIFPSILNFQLRWVVRSTPVILEERELSVDLVNYMVLKFCFNKSFPSTCPLSSSAQGEMCVPREFKIRMRIRKLKA